MNTHKMIVKFLGGNRAGYVTQNADGSLQVHEELLVDTRSLRDLVTEIVSEPELTYHTGHEEDTPDGRRWVTIVRRCQRGDPDYLFALADTITRGRYKLRGLRVRAYVEP